MARRFSRTSLVLAGLRHGLARHLGVAAGVAIAAAVLVGGLAIGDSVRYTLAAAAEARLGRVEAVLAGGDRFFRDALPEALVGGLTEGLGDAPPRGPSVWRAAPVLQLLGTASTSRGDRRVHDVRVHGIDARFHAFAPGSADAASAAAAASGAAGPALAAPAPRTAHVSAAFARALGVDVGDTVVVRVEKPSAVPRDLALAPDENTAALRVEVTRVLSRAEFGEFALDAAPAPAASVFVDLAWLQQQMEVPGRVNLALFEVVENPSRSSGFSTLVDSFERHWTLDDASLRVVTLADGARELTSTRIFFDEPVVAALEALDAAPLTAVFTYFVNAIEARGRRTPYSMVTALGALGRGPAPADPLLDAVAGLADDALYLNSWTLADLGAAPGDEVALDYYVVDASRKLVTRRSTFRVAGEVPAVAGAPLLGTARGRELMPDFPGIADADHCREWEPGTPIDTDAIRDQDEAYWDEHRGTPKAYLTLAAGRALWASRFGALTGVRVAPTDEDAVLAALRARLSPADVGLVLRPVEARAARAGASATDFGGLFIGLSFFLLVAALLLATQLFVFGVEARACELGLFGALGFEGRLVRRLVLGEAAVVAALGAALGAPLGLGFTRLVLLGLDSLWADAVARTPLVYHATPASAVGGAVGALFAALAAAALAVRGLARRTPLSLLTSERGVLGEAPPTRPVPRWLGPGAVALLTGSSAAALAFSVDPRSGAKAAGAFFGAGALVVAAGLALGYGWLSRRGAGAAPARASRTLASVGALGVTNATRRRGRSFGTTTSMALGVFLVLAVGANRLGPVQDVRDRASGTGGFVFYGRTSIPLLHDLATADGRLAAGLDEGDLDGASIVRMRVRDGDDASCLNLARPGAPRLLGVDPEALHARGAFPFQKTSAPTDAPWRLLDEPLASGAVPAIGDVTSLTWQLKLGVGDTLAYVDERGRAFDVEIVAALGDTVLQGDLVISERHFEERFPGQSGYRRALVDVEPGREDAVRAALERALGDVGLALEGTGARLDTFHAVQNTYLAIFQALGALGLLVGSVGLGLLVLRNTEERRGELALLHALGFTRARTARVVGAEYGGLLLAGLVIGGLGAAVAMVPAVLAGGAGALTHVGALLALVGANGALWIVTAIWLVGGRATPAALRAE